MEKVTKMADKISIGSDTVVGLFFGGHWNPKSVVLAKHLAQYPAQTTPSGGKFEIVFAPCRNKEFFEAQAYGISGSRGGMQGADEGGKAREARQIPERTTAATADRACRRSPRIHYCCCLRTLQTLRRGQPSSGKGCRRNGRYCPQETVSWRRCVASLLAAYARPWHRRAIPASWERPS